MTLFDYLKEIPARWWAVCVGITFGSVALITINGAREGYGKSTLTTIGIAPLLCLIAGALLPDGTSLELAALTGGITALGGTTLVMALSKRAPLIIGAAVEAAARSYLSIEDGKQTRIRQDGTPLEPHPELEELAHKLDGGDDDDKH